MTTNNLSAWIDMAEGLYDFLNRRKTTINYKFTDIYLIGNPKEVFKGEITL